MKWLQNGWADYFAPQLYWPIAQTPQSFPVLLGEWIGKNPKNRAVYAGLYTGKYGADEITAQINTTRGFAGASGTVHFSMKSLMPSDRGLRERDASGVKGQSLIDGVYAEPALSPEMPWLVPAGSLLPPAPVVTWTPEASPLAPAVVRWDTARKFGGVTSRGAGAPCGRHMAHDSGSGVVSRGGQFAYVHRRRERVHGRQTPPRQRGSCRRNPARCRRANRAIGQKSRSRAPVESRLCSM